VTAAFIDNFGAAMGATIEKDMHFAVAVAGHDYRLTGEFSGEVVSGVGHLARMTDKKPSSAEHPLHLELENLRIGINAAMHAPGLDELGNFFLGMDGHGLGIPRDGWVQMHLSSQR
jgi:hypothetical protein